MAKLRPDVFSGAASGGRRGLDELACVSWPLIQELLRPR